MNPTERYQYKRKRFYALVRRHDVSAPNIGLFLSDLQQLADELNREDLTDSELTPPPSILALRKSGWFIDPSLWADVERMVKEHNIAPEALTTGARRWMMRGYKKGNVEGLVDFIATGGAGRKQPDTPAPKPTYLPADPSELYEAQS